jgi:hypothetical protein
MSFTDYHCTHCARTRAIETSRVAQATFLRCDACFAISSLTLAARRALIKAASAELCDMRARRTARQRPQDDAVLRRPRANHRRAG